MTCIIGAVFYFVIADFPEDAKWLTEDERRFLKARLQEDVGASQHHQPLKIKNILKTIADREYYALGQMVICTDGIHDLARVLLGGFMYFGLIVPAYSYGTYNIHISPPHHDLTSIFPCSVLCPWYHPIPRLHRRPRPTILCATLGLRIRPIHDSRHRL